jgi:hypothetical protein
MSEGCKRVWGEASRRGENGGEKGAGCGVRIGR